MLGTKIFKQLQTFAAEMGKNFNEIKIELAIKNHRDNTILDLIKENQNRSKENVERLEKQYKDILNDVKTILELKYIK
jgi:hypothetical protein